MNSLQNAIKVCLLLILLSIVAVIPIGVTNIQNEKLINQVHTTKILKEEQIRGKALTTKEKLEIIAKSTLSIQPQVYNQVNKELRDKVVEQLELLQQLEVIPPIDFTQEFTVSDVVKMAYLEFDTPQNVVNIINMKMRFKDYNVTVWMDLDTSVLYQVDVDLKEGATKSIPNIRPALFMEYLGLSSENVSFKADEYGALIVYKEESLEFTYQFKTINGYSYCIVPM